MKIFKRLSAIVLVLVMILSSVGCLHKKNEIAVTIDGFEFTSAYYMCVLINARSEAQNKVYEELSTEEQQQEIDFLSKKIDKKSFTKWTEDRAMEMLKEIAAYKSLCKKADLKIDKEAKENAENTAASYWQYGYSQYFEPNGVSLETYKTYVSDALYSSTYFEYLYGNEGKKAIAQSEVDTELYDSFVTANIIEYTFNDESDSDKATIQTQFEAYLNDLKTGNATFEEIYKAHNNIQEDQEETTTEEDVPKDKYATIVGAEGTNYEHAYFEEIKNMAVGEMQLITKDSDSGYLLVVKTDIKADDYYHKNLDMIARHQLKDEEYAEDIAKIAKKLSVKQNKYAIKQFKVKNIVDPQG